MGILDRLTRCLAMASLLAPIYADCCRNSVAVVASLSGNATVRSRGTHDKVAVYSLDWLSDGMTIEVGKKSQVVIILLNGHRYELNEGAKATLSPGAAPKIKGSSRELPALPPIPKSIPIVADPTTTSGAVRIRGATEMSGLYPRAGIVAIPEKVTLRFNAVPEATSYRVALEDDRGDRLLNIVTESNELAVPSGTIKPGAHYFWHVRAMRSGVLIGVGMAEFFALSAADTLLRSQFAQAFNVKNGATLALLADVDLRLGLVAEACDEFSEAFKQKPNDPALRRALDSAREILVGKN
jgi:hypothetical protein